MPDLQLYSVRNGEVQAHAGLNWGFADANVNTCDAYIALTVDFFRTNPGFFPPHGNVITIEWDDGEIMEGLLEGTQQINEETFPKQISSNGDKSVLGDYLRRRLNVSDEHLITMNDLAAYGKSYIVVSRLSNGNYYFDFSV